MRREGIRLKLAELISEVLGQTHALTYANVLRWVNSRELLRLKRIRDDTYISPSDWLIALQVCREDRRTEFHRISKEDRTPQRQRHKKILKNLEYSVFESSNTPSNTQYV